MDFALFYDGNRTIWGAGKSHALPRQEDRAFFVGDFELNDGGWVAFERGGVSEGWSPPVAEFPYADEWLLAEQVAFDGLWDGANESFRAGRIKKIVLAVSDVAKNINWRHLSVPAMPYFYAFRLGTKFVWGLSPEILFRANFIDKSVETVALAGTRRRGETNEREGISDEHQAVVNFFSGIAEKNAWQLEVAAAAWRDFGLLQHLETKLKFRGIPTDDLSLVLREFHPTPALGVYPRNGETMDFLRRLRSRAELPLNYGAPFGFCDKMQATFVVMIRGHFFENGILKRPIGVGVTAASDPREEWQEIELKRQSMEKLWDR